MSKEELLKQVETALDSVRPHLKTDGGDVEVIGISDERVVFVKWVGNCEWCSMSAMTMKAGIERSIISKVPEITSIVAVNGVDVS